MMTRHTPSLISVYFELSLKGRSTIGMAVVRRFQRVMTVVWREVWRYRASSKPLCVVIGENWAKGEETDLGLIYHLTLNRGAVVLLQPGTIHKA